MYEAKLSTVRVSDFRGVDLSSPPAHVAPSRSPDAPNMMPDFSGKPVKRPGYSLKRSLGGEIFGAFVLRTAAGDHLLIHSGTKLFLDGGETPVFTGLSPRRSFAKQFGERLFITDGEKLRVFSLSEGGGGVLGKAEDFAYVPTITIGRSAAGGGSAFEPFNLIGKRFREEFSSAAGDKTFQLSFGGLVPGSVAVEVLAAGSAVYDRRWTSLVPGTDFSADEETGAVTLVSAPGVSPIEGEDNVRITAAVEIEGYPERINRCRVSALYGVGGAENRLFLTGNPDFPGVDWHSEMNDLCYFGESWYSEMAGGKSAFLGYSRLGDLLVTHSEDAENDSTVFLRQGVIMDGEAAFPMTNILHGPGAVSLSGFGNLGEEPLFLTKSGVFALTAHDASGEKYAQNRSWFINKALTKSDALGSSVFCPYGHFMLVSAGSRLYLLDGSQKSYDSAAPYSTFQYECYYWENVPATAIWVFENTLYFGDADGNVYAFADPEDSSPGAYTDCGAPIEAHWDLPEISGGRFYNAKALRAVFVKLEPRPHTSVTVRAKINGVWSELWSESAAFRYFRWSGIKWSEFVWQCDDGARSFGRRRLIPALDKMRIRFENAVPGEPFGLYEAGVEFGEAGNKAY